MKKIVATNSRSTGFLVEVIPETVGDDSSDSEDAAASRFVTFQSFPHDGEYIFHEVVKWTTVVLIKVLDK